MSENDKNKQPPIPNKPPTSTPIVENVPMFSENYSSIFDINPNNNNNSNNGGNNNSSIEEMRKMILQSQQMVQQLANLMINQQQNHQQHQIDQQSKPPTRVDIQPFWENDPEGWIKQVEAAFQAAHVSNEQDKYFKIISVLPKNVIDSIKTSIDLSSFDPGKLLTLKNRLIERFKPSKTMRRERLLNRKSLDGLKPSEAWFWAVQIAGDIYTKPELLAHWVKWLPSGIALTIEQQVIQLEKRLDSSANDPLVEESLQLLINTTDLLVERHPEKSDNVSAIRKKRPYSSSSYNNRSRSRNRSFSRERNQQRFDSNGKWCYNHYKYREKARSCANPAKCTFKKRQSNRSTNSISESPSSSTTTTTATTSSIQTINHQQQIPNQHPNQHMLARGSVSSINNNNENRLFIKEYISSQPILIDCGSQISIWPYAATNSKQSMKYDDIKLYAHNGTSINTYGNDIFKINIGFKNDFLFKFIVADSPYILIGMDFLSKFNILADFNKRKLIDGKTGESIVATQKQSSFYGISAVSANADVRIKQILSKYPNITNPNISNEAKHDIKHHIIVTTNQPVACLPTRLDPIRMQQVRNEINIMLEQKIIVPSSSPYASRIVVVPKPNGRVRVCGDYRALNAITQPDRYPMRHIHDFAQQLNNCIIFSTIDLVSAFHQIPLAESDRNKTAITTPFGLYEYTRLPFGLRNAPSTFQRFIDIVLRDLDFVFAYQDDILVASKNENEHVTHLDILFNKLAEFGLTINMDKSTFFKNEVKFLGHKISKDGISVLEEKLDAIINYPVPSSVKSLKRFLGMVNFYRRFIPNAAKFMASLHDLEKVDGNFEWSTERMADFEQVKSLLSKRIKLAYFDPKAKLVLKADASGNGVGAVLEQNSGGSVKPLGFFSKKLKENELNLPTFDKELLALFLAIRHFEYLLEARTFTAFTDHRPLVNALLTKNNTKRSLVQMRQMAYILQFTSDIRYIEGHKNIVADALSRVNVDEIQTSSSSIIESNTPSTSSNTESNPSSSSSNTESNSSSSSNIEELSIERIIDEQVKNKEEMDEYLNHFPEKIRKQKYNHGLLLVHVDEQKIRPVIPKSLYEQIIKLCHGICHYSANRTINEVTNRYFWKSMKKITKDYCRRCVDCQQSKIIRHTITKPVQIEIPTGRFIHINMDIVGPLPVSKNSGNRYLLTCIDRFSRWAEAWPIQDISAETVAKKFVNEWVSRYGVPEKVTTDRGSQFQSELYRNFAKLLGVELISTSAYNPRANGMVERFHRTMKTAIKASAADWEEVLPLIMLGLRTIVREDLKASSAELLYGEKLRIPADLLSNREIDDIASLDFIEKLKQKMSLAKSVVTRPSIDNRNYLPPDLSTAKFVFIRKENTKSLDRPYLGPFEVVKRNKFSYVLKGSKGNFDVSISRLKPALLERTDSRETVKKVRFDIPSKFSSSGRKIVKPIRFLDST